MSNSYDIYQSFKDIFFTLEDGDRAIFRSFGMNPTRFYALYHLKNNPGISLRRLSELMLFNKSSVTRLILGMQDEGLIIREDHQTDRRASRLYLTDEGQSLIESVMAQHGAYNEHRFSQLSEDKQEQLLSLMVEAREILQSELRLAEAVGD